MGTVCRAPVTKEELQNAPLGGEVSGAPSAGSSGGLADWATETPAGGATEAPAEASTVLHFPIPGGSECPRLCFRNLRREAKTGIACWYRPGFGRGRCAV